MSDTGYEIAFSRPHLGEREAEAARRAILSGWVTQGPEVAAFEHEFAEAVGAQHACAVSSCTAALHLALRIIGAGPGNEIITASHSYIAAANSIRLGGASPVFVDIEPNTYNMDPSLIESAVTERTRAILCVHQMGMPCDLRAILRIARRHNLPVIEDAACAVGSEILWNGVWERIGNPHADISCFSFHPRKLITTGDGGMITTSNSDWDRRFRLLRHNGMDIPDHARHGADRVVFESYPVAGYNYRMTDIQAAVGREQLRLLPEFVAHRRELAGRYDRLLAEVPGVATPREPPWARGNWQSYCVRLPAGRDQQRVMQFMLDRGVPTRRGVMCIHREEPYADLGRNARLRESQRASDHSILLPIHHALSRTDQERVVSALREACIAAATARSDYAIASSA